MHGKPKHAAGFSHFPYVNPDAPRGGRLALGMLGTFDSLNPFIIRGVSATGLREYVFESLMARSGDEPFTLYGLIAESVELPPDRAWVTFHLRPEARFADGQPITPDDVLFSHAILKEKGWPYHRSHYGKVAKAEKIGERSVRFTFEAAGDREVPLLLAPDADPAAAQARCRNIRAHHAGAAARQRPLQRRARGCRPLHHLSAQCRLVGARSARDARAVQLRRDPHRVLPRCLDDVRGVQGRRDRREAGGRSRTVGRGLRLCGRRPTGASSSANSTPVCPPACRGWCSIRAGRRSRTRACAALSTCCSTPSG